MGGAKRALLEATMTPRCWHCGDPLYGAERDQGWHANCREKYARECSEAREQKLLEELANANKTIEHLTAAYKVLRDRLDLAHQHNRTLRKLMIEKARKEREL